MLTDKEKMIEEIFEIPYSEFTKLEESEQQKLLERAQILYEEWGSCDYLPQSLSNHVIAMMSRSSLPIIHKTHDSSYVSLEKNESVANLTVFPRKRTPNSFRVCKIGFSEIEEQEWYDCHPLRKILHKTFHISF